MKAQPPNFYFHVSPVILRLHNSYPYVLRSRRRSRNWWWWSWFRGSFFARNSFWFWFCFWRIIALRPKIPICITREHVLYQPNPQRDIKRSFESDAIAILTVWIWRVCKIRNLQKQWNILRKPNSTFQGKALDGKNEHFLKNPMMPILLVLLRRWVFITSCHANNIIITTISI